MRCFLNCRILHRFLPQLFSIRFYWKVLCCHQQGTTLGDLWKYFIRWRFWIQGLCLLPGLSSSTLGCSVNILSGCMYYMVYACILHHLVSIRCRWGENVVASIKCCCLVIFDCKAMVTFHRLSRRVSTTLGRWWRLVFNQVTMYKVDTNVTMVAWRAGGGQGGG